jgi:hypothetical protein
VNGVRHTAVLLLVTGILAAGCGDDGAPPGVPAAEDGPLTSRAIAAVMLDHLPDDTTHRQATNVDEYSPKGLVGADFRYHGGGEDDGDLVSLTVAPGKPDPCIPAEHCTDLGDGVQLRWGLHVPEEDPGSVAVLRQRGDELVTVVYSGPTITGDPRDLDIEHSVETLAELVRDPRLRLDADGATLAAGEEVEDWRGGEVDPADLEQVPQTDASIVVGWIYAYGDAWRYLGPSPLKRVLGKDAIGGRVRVTGDLQVQRSGYLDALAAPRPPPWLEEGCLDGYRCGRFQGVHVIYRPAAGDDPGDAFLLHVGRDGETVATHAVGNRIPDDVSDAAWAAGLGLWSYDLTDPMSETRIALTTTREKREAAEKRAGASR